MMTPDALIDYVARNESGGRYDAWTPDDNAWGVSYGLIQFNQKRGSLPQLLTRMSIADRDLWKSIFSPDDDAILLDEARLRDLRKSNLNKGNLREKLEAAGGHVVFRQVQRDLAREGYLDPAWKACQSVGLTSERAVAMAFDAAVQRGVGWMRKNLQSACNAKEGATDLECLTLFAERADAGLGDANGRRHKILRDPALSDASWSLDAPEPPARPPLRRGSKGPAVEDLQRLLNAALALKVDGVFGAKTEWALLRFTRRHDELAPTIVISPPIETTPEVWAALDAAAKEPRP